MQQDTLPSLGNVRDQYAVVKEPETSTEAPNALSLLKQQIERNGIDLRARLYGDIYANKAEYTVWPARASKQVTVVKPHPPRWKNSRRVQIPSRETAQGVGAPQPTYCTVKAQPKLLQLLEQQLKHGLTSITHVKDTNVETLHLRLLLVTELLTIIGDHFKEYAPIFTHAISEINAVIVAHQACKDKICVLEQQTAESDKQHEIQLRRLQSEKQHINEKLEELEKSVEQYKAENYKEPYERLRKHLISLQQTYDVAREENIIKEGKLKDMEYQLKTVQVNEGTFEAMKVHNENLRNKLNKAENTINDLKVWKEMYMIKIDKERKATQDLENRLHDEINNSAKRITDFEENCKKHRKDIKSLQHTVDRLTLELQGTRESEAALVDENRAMTPRPDLTWVNTMDIPTKPTLGPGGGGSADSLTAGRSTVSICAILKDCVAKWSTATAQLRAERDNANGLLDKTMETAGSGTSTTDIPRCRYFVGRGTAPYIPAFLQATGKVRNRMVSRRDLLTAIRELWQSRMKSQRVPFIEALYQYLKIKHGMPLLVTEWGYSLYDAMHVYKDDPEVSLYFKVLMKQLPEEVYHDMMDSINNLRTWMIKLDTANDTPTGKIPKKRILVQLPKVFGAFTEDDLKSLKHLLDAEQQQLGNSNMVEIKSIMPPSDDTKFNLTPFTSKLKTLYIENIEEYITDMRQVAYKYLDNPKVGLISLESLRKGLAELDPEKPTEVVQKFVLACVKCTNPDYDAMKIGDVPWGEAVNIDKVTQQFNIVFSKRFTRRVLTKSTSVSSLTESETSLQPTPKGTKKHTLPPRVDNEPLRP